MVTDSRRQSFNKIFILQLFECVVKASNKLRKKVKENYSC